MDGKTEPSRAKSFLTAAIRGAKFGGLVGLAAGLLITVGGLIVAVASPVIRAKEFGSTENVLSAIGGGMGGIALTALYGALIGSVVFGVARALKGKRE